MKKYNKILVSVLLVFLVLVGNINTYAMEKKKAVGERSSEEIVIKSYEYDVEELNGDDGGQAVVDKTFTQKTLDNKWEIIKWFVILIIVCIVVIIIISKRSKRDWRKR